MSFSLSHLIRKKNQTLENLSNKGMSSGAAYSAAAAAALAFVFLIFATSSPWTMYSLTYITGPSISAWYGVGPFVAGAQQSAVYLYKPYGYYYYGGIVWWNQLNSANTCAPDSPLLPWSVPNGLCDAKNNFVMPAESMGIQACIVLATIFSFFACCSGFSLSKSRAHGGGGAACNSFLAMVFTIAAFAIWTTWPMSTKLQSAQGDYVPSWTSLSTSPDSNFTISLTPLKITMYYGWTYITTVTSFLLLLYSTVTFSAVSKRLAQEGDDSFGTGNMRAI